MDVSGQLYDNVALFLGKEPLCALNRRLHGSQNRPKLLGESKKYCTVDIKSLAQPGN